VERHSRSNRGSHFLQPTEERQGGGEVILSSGMIPAADRRGDRRDLCQRQRPGGAHLGSAATASLDIAGQRIGALTVDRLGLFEFAFRELPAGRLVGVALVFAGAMLVRLT
jgi:hypothetical protein